MTWIETYSGVAFYPLEPTVDMVRDVGIAHHLALKNRFQGATFSPCSVAAHSVRVSRMCMVMAASANLGKPSLVALCGLLHDAGEAYLPDVPTPIKHKLEGFQEIEDRVLWVVLEHFGVTRSEFAIAEPIVSRADQYALALEAEHFGIGGGRSGAPEWRSGMTLPTDDVAVVGRVRCTAEQGEARSDEYRFMAELKMLLALRKAEVSQ